MGAQIINSEFLKICHDVHGDAYDYKKTSYIRMTDKITVTCKKHGDFQVNPANFIHKKSGCMKCARENRKSRTLDELIMAFISVHGSAYDYSRITETSARKKVEIVCPKHGVFKKYPYEHLNGKGCPVCNKIPKEEFLKRFIDKHGSKYDYGLFDGYTNINQKIKIICPLHGVFEQSINNHLAGRGCRKCAHEAQSIKAAAPYTNVGEIQLYFVRILNIESGDEFLKIGISKNEITERFRNLNGKYKIYKLVSISGSVDSIKKKEEFILENLVDERYKVRDLKLSDVGGWTECFRMSVYHKILELIKNTPE